MIQGCMNSLSQATPITLTDEERSELARLARSTKMEHRTRLKARIMPMAAEGAATRTIGRAPGCTTGTASKWRARYAKDRLAGFSEMQLHGHSRTPANLVNEAHASRVSMAFLERSSVFSGQDSSRHRAASTSVSAASSPNSATPPDFARSRERCASASSTRGRQTARLSRN